jgi:hypothetical protein
MIEETRERKFYIAKMDAPTGRKWATARLDRVRSAVKVKTNLVGNEGHLERRTRSRREDMNPESEMYFT